MRSKLAPIGNAAGIEQGAGTGTGTGSSLKAVLHTWDGEVGAPASSLLVLDCVQKGCLAGFWTLRHTKSH